MFNDLRVSSSIDGQVTSYFASEYPTFVSFIKDYYAFLETNGNPLDILGNVGDLINIDSYTNVSSHAILATSVDSTDDEIEVYGDVNFPPNDGLLKIENEIILYKKRTVKLVLTVNGSEYHTVFSGCTRGYTYNDLDVNGNLTSNIVTTAVAHDSANNLKVYNQSFTYVLYFLEKIRSQYLVDFPNQVLQDNIEKINIDIVLKQIRDFYLSKGTPKSIAFYFKFLYQENAEITNYRDLLMASSDATYRSREIVRIETLDNYPLSQLVDSGAILIQGNNEFPVQTVENVFSFASQVFELEISNGRNLIPTYFTKVTTRFRVVEDTAYVYVDSTYNFSNEGALRIGDNIYSYYDKEFNYFMIRVSDNPNLVINTNDYVYDVNSLARVKERNSAIIEGSYFIVYAGVSDFEIIKNTTYYQEGDLGFVTNIIDETNLLVTTWTFNDQTPLPLNQDIIAGVTQVYTDSEAVYVYTSSIPYYDINPGGNYLQNNNIEIKDAKLFKKIPKVFEKAVDTLQESTSPNNVVGILRDGTYIHNWKSEERIIRGGVETINIVNSGDNFAINNPPKLKIEPPFKDAIGNISITSSSTILSEANKSYEVGGFSTSGSGARFNIVRNSSGSVQSVKVVDSSPGNGYDVGVSIFIDGSIVGGVSEDDDIKLEVTDIWSGEDAEAEMVISGQVKEVYIKDGGTGYPANTTAVNVIRDPSDTVFSGDNFRDATLKPIVVDGKITKIRILDPGTGYTKPPIVEITPLISSDFSADIELQVGGPVSNIVITDKGTNYRSNPAIDVVRGLGASGILTIDDGRITNASIVSGGSQYNSRPIVRVVDSSQTPGFGAILIAEWNPVSNQVEGINILNAGLGYNQTSTSIEIFEPGEGLLINSSVKFYTKVNNTNPNLDNLIDEDSGAFYTDPTGILTDNDGNQTFLRKYSIVGAPLKLQIRNPVTKERETVNLQDANNHSPLIGWALDGAPIYGPYGYSNPLDKNSPLKKMRSGYELLNYPNMELERSSNRGDGGLRTDYARGEFEQDYVWRARNADLDQNNGRYCITPDYPQGVYAYFLTAKANQPSKGFPYFIGTKFAGKIFSSFNNQQFINIESIPNLRRYLDFDATIAPKPIDPGFFKVASIPTSTDASLDFIDVITSGSGYKFGDIVNFDNEQTGGSDASGFVSVLKGQPITTVTKSTYDYLEYTNDFGFFDVGDNISSSEGFLAEIHSIDISNRRMYLTNANGQSEIIGDLPNANNRDVVFNTELTIDTESVSELVGTSVSTNVVTASEKFALINESGGISKGTTSFLIDNFSTTGNTIGDFTPTSGNPVYVKVGSEIMRVISVQGNNRLLVSRGVNTFASSHDNNFNVSILTSVPVYDSSKYSIGDYIKIDDEKMKIVDVLVEKDPQNRVVAVKIDDTSGTTGGNQYYLYFNGEIQTNTTISDTITLDLNGKIADVEFTPSATEFISNPKVFLSTSSTNNTGEEFPPNIVPNVTLTATTYRHTLIVERAALGTSIADHTPRTDVERLFFSTAEVTNYEQDRIVSKFNASNNGLISGDFVSVTASTGNTEIFNVYQPQNGQLKLSTGANFNATYSNGLTLYEGSFYEFNVSYTVGTYKDIDVKFFTPGTTTRREYFDINIIKEFGSNPNDDGKLVKFTLNPDDSDLTKVNMEIRNISNDLVTTIPLTIMAEPINGSYDVINSGSTFFEVYNENDPDPDDELLTQYNQNKISYTTTSKNANGPISRVTLTNSGVNYQQVPEISSIDTVDGEGAILEAVSTKVGTIASVEAINSGYGYSPDPTQKPTLIFPVIAKLKNNFTVSNVVVNDPGEGYLFQPRINVTGGGLPVDSGNHARFSPNITSRTIESMDVIFPGLRYNDAPTITAEKYYYISLISGTDINFNINFKEYFQEGDPFKIRAYYFANSTDAANGFYSFIESATFYAFLGNVSLKARAQGANINLEPLDPAYWEDDINSIITSSGVYYEAVNFSRNAQFTATLVKSPFSEGEKVNISRLVGNDSVTIGTGEISNINGWQDNNSILRINSITTKLKENDEILGVNTLALGVVDEIFSVETSAKLDAIVQTPKQFLDEGSFIGENALKIQDSNRYQKFAYQIGVQTPFVEWRENYENALHPAGYKVFSKTDIISSADDSILHENYRPVDDPATNYDETDLIKDGNTIVNVGTTSAELAQFRRKYNFLVAKNEPNRFDSVLIANKKLTDLLNIKTSIVGVFEDISNQFDGVKTLFELKVIDPVTPTLNGSPNYIVDYEVDQMVVLLDNIIQTYGTSWEVIDADKVISFTAQQAASAPMPDGETLSYRQFNDANVIYTMNQTSVIESSVFTLNQTDGTVWPSGLFSSIDKDEYLVFVDGVIQRNDNFSISAGGGTPTITFTDDDVSNTPINLPIGTQISVRQSTAFIKNELYTGSGGVFTPGTVTFGTPVVLPNKPATPASKHDYFVFVDGILISPDDYGLDVNKDIIFNYGFNYDTLIVLIDGNGVSLNESTHGISGTNYVYKIEDGQLEIPTGFVINPEQYVIDIAGIVQTPHVVYETNSSGVRKIRFFEPPSRYIIEDASSDRSEIGRQFIGFLYTRLDPEGNTTTPNYQFDDVSISKIHVKEGFDNFVTGDFINTSTSSAIIKRKIENTTIKSISLGFTGSLAVGATANITLSSSLKVFVGDRVLFNSALGLTSVDNDELEITAINGNVITVENIGSSSLTLNIPTNGTIKFLHREFVIVNISTSLPDRDNSFTAGNTIESGIVSSLRTGTSTLTNEPFSALITDTEITVDDASIFVNGDYLIINEVEIVKITNISSNILTVDRAQLSTDSVLHPDNVVVEKITPYTLTVASFIRGFDGDKTVFPLKENGTNINIGTDKDIFVVVNGILQQKGVNDSYIINLVGSSPNQYSVISFTEAPPEGAPLNIFYLGEVKALKDISPLFNASDRAFNLVNPTNDEVFSLVAESRPPANISANLIIFIDGSLQIPSTEEANRIPAYPNSLVSYKLFGSVVEFSAPPKNGATFEGYIYVGSNDDFEEIDVDPPVEREDIIIQSNERRSREVNLIVSADKLSVGSSFGEINTIPNASNPQLNDGSAGHWFTDLLQTADIRETLRGRRTLKAKILKIEDNNYPITDSTLLTEDINQITISNIDNSLPTTTDANSFFSVILAANNKFPVRKLNCIYSSFGPRLDVNNTNYDFVAGDVNTTDNEIQLTATTGVYDSHALRQGAEVIYNNGSNTDMPGLVNGIRYYVHVVDQHIIKLAETKGDLESSNFVNITGTSAGTHSIISEEHDIISNMTVGFDLKYDQIVRLASTASNETFSTLTTVDTGKIGSATITEQGSGFANGVTNNVNIVSLQKLYSGATIVPGSGYNNNIGNNGVYTNVPLDGGTGNGARANIVVKNNSISKVTITNSGNNSYTAGDVLTIDNANLIDSNGLTSGGAGFSYTLGSDINDSGENGTVNVTVSFGVPTSIEIVNQGSNYLDGQIVGIEGFLNVRLKVSEINPVIYYDNGSKKATVIDYTPGETVDGSSTTTRYLYVKLDDPDNPITTYAANNSTGAITNVNNITHQVEDDDLMIDYQSLSYNDDFIYDF